MLPTSHSIRQELLEKLNIAQSEHNSAVKRLEYEYQVEISRVNLENSRQDFEKYDHGPNQQDIELT